MKTSSELAAKTKLNHFCRDTAMFSSYSKEHHAEIKTHRLWLSDDLCNRFASFLEKIGCADGVARHVGLQL